MHRFNWHPKHGKGAPMKSTLSLLTFVSLMANLAVTNPAEKENVLCGGNFFRGVLAVKEDFKKVEINLKTFGF